jgi:competence protein ComEC
VNKFWQLRPALFFGLFLLVGVALQLTGQLLPLLLLVPTLRCRWDRLLGGGVVALAGFLYCHAALSLPTLDESVVGEALIHPERVYANRGSWVIHGKLRQFRAHGVELVRGGRVRVVVRPGLLRPSCDADYVVEGALTGGPNYRLKVERQAPWHRVAGSWSIAEWRLDAKQKIHANLKRHLPPREAGFLAALTTGEFCDSAILFAFSRMGLMHLMAISGFHFSIVAGLAALLFRGWLRPKASALALVILLSLYLTLVGASPSMLRAWVMATLFFFGWVVERRSNGLNTLGVALLVLLLWDPISILSLGFQFSFACTAAILLFYQPFYRLLGGQVDGAELSLWDQHGALVLLWLRRGLAVTLAVHLVAIPLTLYAFHRFPLMGLVYNLVFPVGIALALGWLPFCWVAYAIFPPLGALCFGLEQLLTQAMLGMASAIPSRLDFFFRVESVPAWLLMGLGVLMLTPIAVDLRERAVV